MDLTYSFDQPPAVDPNEGVRILGGKGYNLAVMRSELGLPVPPGFTITTEAWKEHVSEGWPERLDQQLRRQIERLEGEVGRRFAGAGEPLLVSVRSGAAVSMPGMMDTILNLGLHDGNVAELARACDNDAFARESLQRFQDMYREIVGDEPPDDPWAALRAAVVAVFDSWNTDRARAYRQREGIPDDLGTAVTIQAMVFGNLDDRSGTGVLFTRNPATGEKAPYGDFLFRAQGEDVVSGSKKTEPLMALQDRLPDTASELFRHADTLERYFKDVCDIEFTIERGRLYLLQVRVGKRSPQAALQFAVDMAEDETFPLSRSEAIQRVAALLVDPPVSTVRTRDATAMTVGLPASPGLVSGQVATSTEGAVEAAEAGQDVILVRPETSPKDIHGMACAKGILTTTGGLASHAAVVARGWGLPAVVGATSVTCAEGLIVIEGETLKDGDWLTIDGHTGEVFIGKIETESQRFPAVDKLLEWAESLGIDLGSLVDEGSRQLRDTTDAVNALDEDSVLRALHIKGFATAESLAPVVRANEEDAKQVLGSMFDAGLLKMMGEMYQLDDEGRHKAQALMEKDREELTVDRALAALDGFVALDGRMKRLVTSWQMREVDGEQVINDHTDEGHDREVLRGLDDLHDDAMAWIEPLTTELSRLDSYRARLSEAVDSIRAGRHEFIASPLVDSYHNIWFELHEDLIQLAGRTREEETQAGRA